MMEVDEPSPATIAATTVFNIPELSRLIFSAKYEAFLASVVHWLRICREVVGGRLVESSKQKRRHMRALQEAGGFHWDRQAQYREMLRELDALEAKRAALVLSMCKVDERCWKNLTSASLRQRRREMHFVSGSKLRQLRTAMKHILAGTLYYPQFLADVPAARFYAVEDKKLTLYDYFDCKGEALLYQNSLLQAAESPAVARGYGVV